MEHNLNKNASGGMLPCEFTPQNIEALIKEIEKIISIKKTYRQHFLDSNEPWAKDALMHMEKYGITAENKSKYLSDAILGGFRWYGTGPEQGAAYWSSVYWDTRNKERENDGIKEATP